jgi:hypothetical protein
VHYTRHEDRHISVQTRIFMKVLLLSAVSMITLLSCNNNLYGTYNTNHSKDKSSFYQIKLNADYTIEKTEIHTISDFAKGRFLVTNGNQVVCFLDSSSSKFPPDTLTFKLKRKKLYFLRNESINRDAYLAKQ